ncbi:MAG TPA: YdeI/OmpD-associated family protein [Flavobacterium sp.]|jgi:uncharacterized protein YdeI (YjbR/CyaY-like superfamily)
MEPQFFETQYDFRKWLEENHTSEKELLVGYYKVGSGRPSMTWPESVDQALCFGWIDGIRRSVDEQSYSIRFTPRKPSSIWSSVNIRKIEELTKAGLMQPAGIAAYEKKTEKNSSIYAYESEGKSLSVEFEKRFQQNQIAWEFFNKQAPSYRKRMVHWVVSAKQEATRESRLQKLISESEAGKRV